MKEISDIKKKVFVVIITYNGERWIQKCFDSLRQSSISLHIIVIDNKSTDNTVKTIQLAYPEVHLIESSENIGFGQANNEGIALALKEGAAYIFLLNQDAWVEPNTIAALVLGMEANQEYGILSPMHLNGAGTDLDANFSTYLVRGNPKFVSDLYLDKIKKIYACSFVNAAAWLISRECLKKVGGFDPLFFHYGEDENYCQRVIFHGIKIGVMSNATIYHDRDDRGGNILAEYKDKGGKRRRLLQLTDLNNTNFELQLTGIKKHAIRNIFVGIVLIKFKTFNIGYKVLREYNKYKKSIYKSRRMNSTIPCNNYFCK